MPRYYTLAVKEDGYWRAEFGDFDRSTVIAEKAHYRNGYAAKDLLVLLSEPEQYAINEAVASLNGRG